MIVQRGQRRRLGLVSTIVDGSTIIGSSPIQRGPVARRTMPSPPVRTTTPVIPPIGPARPVAPGWGSTPAPVWNPSQPQPWQGGSGDITGPGGYGRNGGGDGSGYGAQV